VTTFELLDFKVKNEDECYFIIFCTNTLDYKLFRGKIKGSTRDLKIYSTLVTASTGISN